MSSKSGLVSALPVKRVNRFSISAMFYCNGLMVGVWALLVPVLLVKLAITERDIGLMIFAGGLASMAALYFSGYLVQRFGSKPVTGLAAMGMPGGLIAVYMMPTYGLAVAMFVLFFVLMAMMDIAMNANAAAHERIHKAQVMSSFHGFWSLGSMSGALAGGLVLGWSGPAVMTIAAGAAALGLAMIAFPGLISDSRDMSDEAALEAPSLHLPKMPVIYVFGAIALFSFVAEGAVIDWSALYLRQELAFPAAQSGFALAAFSAAMVLARFTGDRVNRMFGPKRLLIGSAILSATGFFLSGTGSLTHLVVAGFFMAGLGIANMFPIALSSAAKLKGISSEKAIATVSMCGYSGLLAAPAALGYIGEFTGFAPIFLAFVVPMSSIAFIAVLLRRANRI